MPEAAKTERAGQLPGPERTGGPAPALVVALDQPSAGPALALADSLRGLPVWLKLGLELFTAEGPDLARRLMERGFALFLDLKFHDIPNTVQGAVRSAALLGARMTTLHLCGGEAMCRAAVAGRDQGRDALWQKTGGPAHGPLLMGVTVLTSEAGPEDEIRARVVERARRARDWGLDGVVCSGREAAAVKAACGRDFLCLCPGIRFADFAGGDDQARVCTPGQAVLAGADFLVMGRPVAGAENPAAAAALALEEMERALRI